LSQRSRWSLRALAAAASKCSLFLKKCTESLCDGDRVFGLTLPDYQNIPTEAAKSTAVLRITFFVPIEFGIPECFSCRGAGGEAAPGVLMPETTLHFHDLSARWKDQIRRAG
jgi:hypothetical protein